MLTLDQSAQPHPDVVDTALDDGDTVLLHLESKTYYSLNSSGSRIWQGIKRGTTLREISRCLQEEFEVEPQMADSSVLHIAGELSRERLVVPFGS